MDNIKKETKRPHAKAIIAVVGIGIIGVVAAVVFQNILPPEALWALVVIVSGTLGMWIASRNAAEAPTRGKKILYFLFYGFGGLAFFFALLMVILIVLFFYIF